MNLRRANHRTISGSNARGAAAVELALILMLMVSLTVGIVEVGRALYAYDVLAKSVRSAARYYVVLDDLVYPLLADRKRAARCVAAYANPGCTGTALLPNLVESSFEVIEPPANTVVDNVETGGTNGTIDLVTVTIVSYSFVSWVPVIFPSINLGPISMTVPYVFF